MLSVV
jgi:hypothetical protein